jgi:hypothetical protein
MQDFVILHELRTVNGQKQIREVYLIGGGGDKIRKMGSVEAVHAEIREKRCSCDLERALDIAGKYQ